MSPFLVCWWRPCPRGRRAATNVYFAHIYIHRMFESCGAAWGTCVHTAPDYLQRLGQKYVCTTPNSNSRKRPKKKQQLSSSGSEGCTYLGLLIVNTFDDSAGTKTLKPWSLRTVCCCVSQIPNLPKFSNSKPVFFFSSKAQNILYMYLGTHNVYI